MKSLLPLMLLGCCFANAQTTENTITINSDLKLMGGYTTGNATGYNVIPIYNPTEIKGNPYFSKDWLKGSVTTADDKTFAAGLLFMYNKYNNELYYKQQDSSVTMKIDLSRINAFMLISNEPHTFTRADVFDKKYSDEFFETLVLDNDKYSFLKLDKTILQDPPYSEVAQAANNDRAKTFTDKNTYFIYTKGQLTEVELKKKSFEKVLSADADFEKYLKDNGGSFNEKYVALMLTKLNSN